MNNTRRQDLLFYICSDAVMVIIAWMVFSSQSLTDHSWSITDNLSLKSIGLLLFVLTGWMLLYSILDSYKDLYRQSRLATLALTVLAVFLGCSVVVILGKNIFEGGAIFSNFFHYFIWHFSLSAIVRMILLTRASRRLKAGSVTFNTLIIGGNENALELYKEITSRKKGLGYHFVGFLNTDHSSENSLAIELPNLGSLNELNQSISKHKIEEVIIALEPDEESKLPDILNSLFDFGNSILIKVIPGMYDLMLGSVKMNHVYGAVLIEVEQSIMPRWQMIVKRIIDVVISLLVMIILSPLYLYILIRVLLSSPGKAIFRQERIGINFKPFYIYKFRSMFTDAEESGPQLSSENDSRCTPWGATMRKWRLDELPQFWNVLKGEMSIVGPRPERRYYIDLIMKQASHYKHLLKVRPGITSWGQVKYGYASDVNQMLHRLKFDILYIENMSLALDFKIMFYTLLVLFQGKGK